MKPPASGFTLIELVVAIVIITAAGGTLLGLLASMSRSSAELMVRSQCANIANAYLSEILSTSFNDPDGLPEAGRANFDNVGDYNGLSNVGVEDRFGNAVASLDDYTVNVTVSQPAAGLGAVPAAQTYFVEIDVDHMSTDCVVLSGFKTQHP
jgi:MSHA pilin protein MshD